MHHMTRTEFIKHRRSVRKFLPGPVEERIIRDILDCARLATTANNQQPWLFGAVTDPALLGAIADLTEFGKFIRGAPVCFAVFCRADQKYYLEDGCAATQNILLAATAHGLGSCWVAGDKKAYGADVAKLLGVPAGYTLVALAPAGVPAETPTPRKKDLSEVAFRDTFGKKA
jgi:nitroreductase